MTEANVYTTDKPSSDLIATTVMATQATRSGTDFDTVSGDAGIATARQVDNEGIEFEIDPNGLTDAMQLNVTPVGGTPYKMELTPGQSIEKQISNAMSRATGAVSELMKGLKF